jgi:threonyl-tRNA synthetase
VWLPNGVAIRDELENFIKQLENKQGYQRVVSPHLGKSILYERSGHLKSFKNEMFPSIKWPDDDSEYYLKPMNCPHHHKVFASHPRSYRQLPLRLAEYGQIYRYENSGSLHGLSRVRGCCQNDAHIYLDPQEIYKEIENVLELHEHCYQILNIKNYRYRLSKHDPMRPDVFEGDKKMWLHAENILREVLVKKKLSFYEAEGEAAFYGPKIDVQFSINQKEESVASIQIDFLSAERFDLSFISSDGSKRRPWIIHRAPLGSHERFVAMLLEFYQGQMPAWLSPIQLYLLPVDDLGVELANRIYQECLDFNIRVHVDKNLGSLSKRILYAHKCRPYSMAILGRNESQSQQLHLQFRKEKYPVHADGVASVINKVVVESKTF